MAAFRVVPAFQAFEEGHARLGLGAKGAPVDEFALEGSKEAFGHRIRQSIQLHSIPTLSVEPFG